MAISSPSACRAGEALQQSPIPALRKLSVRENDAEIILIGRVASFYQKQLAQETVLPLLGSRALKNLVEVVRTEKYSED